MVYYVLVKSVPAARRHLVVVVVVWRPPGRADTGEEGRGGCGLSGGVCGSKSMVNCRPRRGIVNCSMKRSAPGILVAVCVSVSVDLI